MTIKTKAKTTNVKPIINELGAVKSQLAALKKVEQKLRDKLAALGNAEIDTDFYHCTVVTAQHPITDWHALCESQKIPQKTIDKFTEWAERTTVTVRGM